MTVKHGAVINRGLSTFVEVGKALLAIRDAKLYRKEHKTFEAYCRERWGMSRTYAHRTIEAAEVAENLLPMGNNVNNCSHPPVSERVARPLTRLSKSEQKEAWRLVTARI